MGNRKKESTGTSDKKLAEQILMKRKTSIIEGKFGIEKPEEVTFSEALEQFFAANDKTIKASTIERYKYSALKLQPFFNGKNINAITVTDIDKFRQERSKTWSLATVNRDIEFLRRLLNFCKKRNMLTRNPVEDVTFYKEDNIRTRFLELDEIHRLFCECRQISYLFLAVNIALNTGMRKGEIMSLQIPQDGDNLDKINWIDMDNRCFHLNITKTSQYRNVPINDTIFPLIEKAILMSKGKNLFPVKDVRAGFENALKRAGIKNATFHDLRRTFISHAMMKGYSQEVIQRVVGQDDPTIFKRYAHLAPDMKKQVLNEMGRMFQEDNAEAN